MIIQEQIKIVQKYKITLIHDCSRTYVIPLVHKLF